MSAGMVKFLGEFKERYPWLTGMTDSECMEYLADYLDMDYRMVREEDGFKLHCVNFRKPLKFIMRTTRNPIAMEGGTYQKIGDDAWLLTVESEHSEVRYEE